MSEHWKPSVQIWPFRDAPIELLEAYREVVSSGDGDEELMIYVPGEILNETGSLASASPSLWFLDWLPRFPTHEKYAGSDWGWYVMIPLRDGGRIAVTRGSEKPLTERELKDHAERSD
jgi:hypothetical protein